MLRVLTGTAIRLRQPSDDDCLVMETNLDNTTGEQIGFAIERLFEAGALDVFTSPIQMKKGRPGTLLSVLARPQDREAMEAILFQQTNTLGVRYARYQRTVLPRKLVEVSTEWGTVRGKLASRPGDIIDFAPEYEDCRRLANANGVRLAQVYEAARDAWSVSQDTLGTTSHSSASPRRSFSVYEANRAFDITAQNRTLFTTAQARFPRPRPLCRSPI